MKAALLRVLEALVVAILSEVVRRVFVWALDEEGES